MMNFNKISTLKVNEMLFNVMKPDTEDEKTTDDDKIDKNFIKQVSGQEKKLTKESKSILLKGLFFLIKFSEAEVLRNKIKFVSKMMKFNKTIR